MGLSLNLLGVRPCLHCIVWAVEGPFTIPLMFHAACHLLGTLCTLFVLVLLPASNQGLPFSTHPWLLPLSSVAVLLLALSRLTMKPALAFTRVELQLLAIPAALLGYGLLLTFFPSGMMDKETGTLLAFDADPWRAFGSLDQRSSARAMSGVATTAMLFICVSLLATKRSGRIALASAVTVAGVIAAITGLALQTCMDRSSLWQQPHIPSTVFGLFWYHGSAASFMNLTWPWAVWLFLVTKQARMRLGWKNPLLALLAASVLLQWIAVVANMSKMGHVLLLAQSCLLLTSLYLLVGRRQSHGIKEYLRHGLLIGSALVVTLAGAWVTGASQGWMRWGTFSKRGFDDPARRHATAMALRLGNESGWTGTGPGTFEIVSPHYSILDPILAGGHWHHAHNDYAQFYAEWGTLGVILLALLLVCPGVRLSKLILKAIKRGRHEQISYHRLTALGCLLPAAVSMLIHATVDFPFQIQATQGLFATLAAVIFTLPGPSHDKAEQRLASTRKWSHQGRLAPIKVIDHSFFNKDQSSHNSA